MKNPTSFLEQAYANDARIWDPKYDQTPESLAVQAKIRKLDEQFLPMLSPEAEKLFQIRSELQLDYDDLIRKQFFKRAFRIGAHCKKEVFLEKDAPEGPENPV